MKRIVVIGGGPAGIEAARSAAQVGRSAPGSLRVTLISDEPPGGRAGWHSLAPSKVWLAAAQALHNVQAAASLGVQVQRPARVDPNAVLDRIHQVTEQWNHQQAAELDSLGVEIILGRAKLAGPRTVQVEPAGIGLVETIEAGAIILAGGSAPRFPAGMQPDGERVYSPRLAGKLARIPGSMVVIGGGPTGSEFASLFSSLGSHVTWVVDEYGILPGFDAQAGQFLAEAFQQRGMEILRSESAVQIDHSESGVQVITHTGRNIPAEMAFIATGRTPDVSALNLDAAGIQMEAGRIQVDSFCQTNVPGIYAAGDITGGPMLANKALAQARIAARQAAGALARPYREETIVAAVYSLPEIAQVGKMGREEEGIHTVRLPYQAGLAGHLHSEAEGFLELAFQVSDECLTGALAGGPHAAELLTSVALAIHTRASLSDLADIGPAYPTLGDVLSQAAELGRASTAQVGRMSMEGINGRFESA